MKQCHDAHINCDSSLDDMEAEDDVEEDFAEKENIVISTEKPKYTYRELITLALADKTCLTLSNIYSWIR